MNDGEVDPTPAPVVCARCARPPRDESDRTSWVTLASVEICPGCLTMNDREQLQD
jgi:hypothetical protein